MVLLGENIRKIRELKNFSQKYMACKLGISQGAYSCMECGKTRISYQRICDVAKILQVDPGIIINFSEKALFNSRDRYDLDIKIIKTFYEELLQRKSKEITKLREDLGKG